MFNVHLRGKNMRFEFRHTTISSGSNDPKLDATKDLTLCYLFTDKRDTRVPDHQVIVVRKHGERFVKYLANKAALTKLLKQLDFNKVERKEVWFEFFRTRNFKTM